MFMPSIFGRTAMDDFFDNAFSGYQTSGLMKTDIKETDTAYELAIDLPGVKKEDVKAELKDGYLNIGVSSGSYSRSFYVGDGVTQDEVKAKFDNGVLKLTVPKKEAAPEVETNKYIAIEG